VGTRCADHVTPLYPQKLALTSPTGGGRSVGIVRSRTKATELVSYIIFHYIILYYITLHYVMLFYVTFYNVILDYFILYFIILYYIILRITLYY